MIVKVMWKGRTFYWAGSARKTKHGFVSIALKKAKKEEEETFRSAYRELKNGMSRKGIKVTISPHLKRGEKANEAREIAIRASGIGKDLLKIVAETGTEGVLLGEAATWTDPRMRFSRRGKGKKRVPAQLRIE